MSAELTQGSEDLHTFQLPRRWVLIIGNERSGVGEDVLALVAGVTASRASAMKITTHRRAGTHPQAR